MAILLEDHCVCLETLVVPHGGLQKDRFTATVHARNAFNCMDKKRFSTTAISAYVLTKMLMERVHYSVASLAQ